MDVHLVHNHIDRMMNAALVQLPEVLLEDIECRRPSNLVILFRNSGRAWHEKISDIILNEALNKVVWQQSKIRVDIDINNIPSSKLTFIYDHDLNLLNLTVQLELMVVVL